jgi:hypothetical protein
MRPSNGSAAVALVAMPQSAVRGCILRCAEALRQTAELAAIAARGSEPELGAVFLIDRLDALRVDLASLRAVARLARRNGTA